MCDEKIRGQHPEGKEGKLKERKRTKWSCRRRRRRRRGEENPRIYLGKTMKKAFADNQCDRDQRGVKDRLKVRGRIE